jgi:hypothetical protein
MSGYSCRLRSLILRVAQVAHRRHKTFLIRSQLFPFTFFYHDQLRILSTLETVIFPANGYCI